MPRAAVISDLHNKWKTLDGRMPEADLLIVCGDLTNVGRPTEIREFDKWIGKQPYVNKVVIGGNHDFGLQQVGASRVRRELIKNAIYLEDEEVTLQGLRIYGSPWTPTFGNWAFMRSDEELKRYWDNIPAGLDILITHGPAYGILDQTVRGPRAGSRTLLEAINRVKPRFHLFGHIHEADGVIVRDGVTHVNATTCDYFYRPVNPARVIDL